MKINLIHITQEKFEAYEELVKIRKVVFWAKIKSIVKLAEKECGVDMNEKEVFEIAKNYKNYLIKYGELY